MNATTIWAVIGLIGTFATGIVLIPRESLSSATPTVTDTTPDVTITSADVSLERALEQARTFAGGNDDWKTLYPTGFIHTFDDGIPMALVPKGCFAIGANRPQKDQQGGNRVCFNHPFWIDQTEVTQADFRRLGGIRSTQDSFPGPQRPVETIRWYEARDFCVQRGGRLPTEAEWEYAARGPDEWDYPWGNAWRDGNAIWNRSADQGTADVGSLRAGASWVGALDLIGNVWEWTNSLYQPYPYRADDGRERDNGAPHVLRVLRGGSWLNADNEYTNQDVLLDRVPYNPFAAILAIGFRCARSSD